MSDGITGRDKLIIAKALAYAIVSIERLPEEWQATSDLNDMKTLFNTIGPKLAHILMISAIPSRTARHRPGQPGIEAV